MNRNRLRIRTCCLAATIMLAGSGSMAVNAAPAAGLSDELSTTISSVTKESTVAGGTLTFAKAVSDSQKADENKENTDNSSEDKSEKAENETPVVKSEYADIAIAQVDNYVNVRSTPGEDGEVLGKLYDKSAATVEGEENGWYKITSGSVTGYVKKEFVVVGNEELARAVGRRMAKVNTETLKVVEGEIRIGGVNIKNIPTEKLMDIVSFVFQDSFLFFDTLYENIRVGNSSAGREEVIAAAKAAQCHEFIESLPQGYETRIGDEGVYLSGGESQRVCVARAILKNAPILVLDEATAFADPENEYKMQQALQHLIQNKTVIIIAHRLSSIISAQQIIVLNEGKLVQHGKHEILSKTEGLYKNMWDAYTDAFRWELNSKKEVKE